MPRDSHLLPEHSQQLLRAARAGRASNPNGSSADDEKESADEDEDKRDVYRGYTIKKYSKIPRHLEDSEPEYLAKRRKGLSSSFAVPTSLISTAPSTATRKTKVKKVDEQGNTQIYEVIVPEGQVVEGEIKADEAKKIETVPVALPGTVVEGVGVVNQDGVVVASDLIQPAPNRRKPPPPKKKKKSGPGRGKKKVIFAEGAPGTSIDGQPNDPSVEALRADGTPGSAAPSDGDTPMGDADEDDGEEGEEGEDGDEGDEDEDMEEGEVADTPLQTPAPPSNIEESAEPQPTAPLPVETQLADDPVPEIPESQGDRTPPIESVSADPQPEEPPPIEVISTISQPLQPEPIEPPLVSEAEVLEAQVTDVEPTEAPSSTDGPAPVEVPIMETAIVEAIPAEVPIERPQSPVKNVPEDEIVAPPPIVADLSTDTTVNATDEPLPAPQDTPDIPSIPIDQEPEQTQAEPTIAEQPATAAADEPAPISAPTTAAIPTASSSEVLMADGEPDLLGSLERHLDEEAQK